MATSHETEWELEEELEGLGEFGQAHEFEEEMEHPAGAHEFETEAEHYEHEFESTPELAQEGELEWEGEGEASEQFFGRIARGIGRFVRRAAPLLRTVARVAAPLVGTAIGGPFGAVLGRVASSALGETDGQRELEHHEHEFESEWEHHEHELTHEFEGEAHLEVHHESAQEIAQEIAHHELTHHEALAEMMAEAASHEQHEAQAEAMVGAAVMTTLSLRDRRALQRLLPNLVRGAAVLTRVLRRRRLTRPAVRAVPTIMRRTVLTLKRQAANGQPVTRRAAARAASLEVRRVLGNPSACAAAIRQNVRATRTLHRSSRG